MGGGGGAGGGGVTGVILVWVSEPVFQSLLHSYTWHSYTWSSKMLTYLYTALWFFVVQYPFFAGCYTNITYNSCNTKRISSLEKSLWKIYDYTRMSEKWGLSLRNPEKSDIHILFVEKRGPIIYLAVLKKGAIRHTHPYYAIYRKLLNPHPPAPPPPPSPWVFLIIFGFFVN